MKSNSLEKQKYLNITNLFKSFTNCEEHNVKFKTEIF